MRLLAIETSGEACSVALFEDGALVDARHETIGRGHAERLVPMIGELPGRGRADEIRVSLGPGSFTGVRIGLAAARALGLAWGARVRGYPTLALVAAMARSQGTDEVAVCMNGGHGEWFVQAFDNAGQPSSELVSLPPQDAVDYLATDKVAGNRAEDFAKASANDIASLSLIADARHVFSIPDALLTDVLSPIYGRAPDAKLPA
ncbi:tRNA (adenosine(37)-N6)-threonylcarbamoyltransferase complex dimerization subunit type 1 TsaB [Qipengyuania sp. GH29]|nr:tRNA (adenosine(37)-N6)-threonylcarbamoyltransferase complex dimerization subunit type 1 TsaB [Qipengyuania sphaerica]